jgi:hypothetical protein
MSKLTDQSIAMLHWIKCEIAAGRPFPSHKERAEKFGANHGEFLLNLVVTGKITRRKSTNIKRRYDYEVAP